MKILNFLGNNMFGLSNVKNAEATKTFWLFFIGGSCIIISIYSIYLKIKLKRFLNSILDEDERYIYEKITGKIFAGNLALIPLLLLLTFLLLLHFQIIKLI